MTLARTRKFPWRRRTPTNLRIGPWRARTSCEGSTTARLLRCDGRWRSIPIVRWRMGSIGTVLAWAGQHDASVASNEFALRVNPQDPSTFFRHFGLALAHYLASRYERALAHASAVLQMRPSWRLGQMLYAASSGQLGRRDEARPILDELAHVRLRESPCPGLASCRMRARTTANTCSTGSGWRDCRTQTIDCAPRAF